MTRKTNIMAFANLFSSLSAVDEDVKRRGQPAFPPRNQSENGGRSNAQKRKGKQLGPHHKKRCYREQQTDTYNTASLEYDDSRAIRHHLQNTDSEHANISFTEDVMHNHSRKANHSEMFRRGQNWAGKNNNRNKQHQQRRKTEWQKNEHPPKNRWKNSDRGGRHQTAGGDRKPKDGTRVNKDVQDKFIRCMTEEFKSQNVVQLDGRFLCRHFLWGKCIKGDDCQLEHIQGFNDLIKQVCKFYVQGFCTKGESCPYMHKSFPCKFFHRRGECSHGVDCRFSHEPLNELTSRLLDEALRRENELARKAEQDLSGQPVHIEESEMIATSTASDIPIQPLRPNFYNSEETTAKEEALLSQAEELSNDMQEPYPPQAQPESPPSPGPIQNEPICYSVEAVLGRQLFKPFPSFFTTPQVEGSTSLPVTQTSSENASGSVNKGEVPYSVDAVLRSYKSVENSTLGHTPTPPAAQTVSYIPKTDCKKATDALLSSQIQNEKALCWFSNKNEQTSKSKEKMVKNQNTGLLQKTHPDPVLVSVDHKKQAGEIQESLKPAHRVSHEVTLHSPVSVAENSISKRHMKGSPRLPVDISCSVNSKRPSAALSEFKCRAAVSPEPVTSSDKTADAENQHCKKTEPRLRQGTQQNHPNEITADCSSEMVRCGELSVGRDKTQRKLFHSLFASPITDKLTPAPDSGPTPASSQSFSQSCCPAPQSAHCTGGDIHVITAADEASPRSFLSLFAAPLTAAAQPPSDNLRTVACSLESNQSTDDKSHLETALQSQVKTADTPKLSTGPKNKNEVLSACVNQRSEQRMNPACILRGSLSEVASSPALCGNSPRPPTTQSHQQQASMSSDKGPSAASANSVLKTLFLCLSPYQKDSVESTAPSESQEDQSSTECVFVEKQLKSKKKCRGKKKFKMQDSGQQGSETTAVHHPSFQTPQMPLEATGGSTVCSPDTMEKVKNSGSHQLPFKPLTPPIQHHSRSRLKHSSEEVKGVDENTAVTPLKDLFKTLESTVFHFGH